MAMAAPLAMGAASIVGSALGGKGANKAAKTAAKAQIKVAEMNNAAALENRNFIAGQIQPYNQQGLAANQQINAQLAGGPYGSTINSTFANSALNPGSFTNFKDSTGYQNRLNEGYDGINTGYAAKGALNSGAAMKAITRFGQDYASNEYGKYIGQLDRYASYNDAWNAQERGYMTDQQNTYFNQLLSQQGVGMNAVGALAGAGTNYTNQVIGSNNQAAAAQSNAALAKGANNQNMYAGIGQGVGMMAGALWPQQQPYNPYGGGLGPVY